MTINKPKGRPYALRYFYAKTRREPVFRLQHCLQHLRAHRNAANLLRSHRPRCVGTDACDTTVEAGGYKLLLRRLFFVVSFFHGR